MILLQDNPIEVRKALEREGIEAYQGATQLRTVYKTPSEPTTSPTKDINSLPKHTSRSLITQPIVQASKVTQSYTIEAAHVNALSASDISQPTLAAGNSTSYSSSTPVNDKEKSYGSQEFVSEFNNSKGILYPYNAEYLINHVLYLPVHKNVPLWYLEYVCHAVDKVMKNRPGVHFKDENKTVILPSKL